MLKPVIVFCLQICAAPMLHIIMISIIPTIFHIINTEQRWYGYQDQMKSRAVKEKTKIFLIIKRGI